MPTTDLALTATLALLPAPQLFEIMEVSNHALITTDSSGPTNALAHTLTTACYNEIARRWPRVDAVATQLNMALPGGTGVAWAALLRGAYQMLYSELPASEMELTSTLRDVATGSAEYGAPDKFCDVP